MVTFPMDTIRRRMQIQNLHVPADQRMSSRQQFYQLITKEGLGSVYRGLTPELLKVIPMVGTLFLEGSTGEIGRPAAIPVRNLSSRGDAVTP